MSTAPTDTHGERPVLSGPPDWAGPQRLAAGAAVIGLAAYGIAGAIHLGMPHTEGTPGGVTQFLASWLAGWTFWFSLPLGGMALLMIHYLAKTSWGVLLRRSLESATRTLPLMALLFVPIVIGAFLHHDSPYWWSDPQAYVDHHGNGHEEAEKHTPPPSSGDKDKDIFDAKRAERAEASKKMVKNRVAHELHDRQHGTWSFLSPPVFAGLAVALFATWGVLIYFLNTWGQDIESDTSKVETSLEKLKNISGPGLIIYAITITAAATQWVMSLEPSWASTMFPVIFAVNQLLTCFAFCVAVFLFLVGRPPFREVMRPKFQLDMGSLMLAFTLFWSYTSFSQLMLIWIGNLPEEIPFYLKRSNDTGWWWVSAALIVFHFAVPFLLLLFRDIKLHPVRLRVMAMYLLVVCAVDVVWWVEPTFYHGSSPLFAVMDAGAVVGIGGVWGLLFLYNLKKRPLLPANELYQLPEGHDHAHH